MAAPRLNRKKAAMHLTLAFLFTVAFSTLALAHDYVPGAKQTAPILLKGGNLYTVTNGVQAATDLIFENGRITQIGKNLATPQGAEVVDVTGMNVYPGLIIASSQIGLIEIDQARATNDKSEVGSDNPDVKAHIAYDPDSEIIPTVRSNGMTTALIVPEGGLFRGRSALINLDGWTWEDAGEKLIVGLHISWPRASTAVPWWSDQTAEEIKKENEENLSDLYETFDNALAYRQAKKANTKLTVDSRLESMIPVVSGTQPVFVHANDFRQIEEAVAFAKKYSLKLVIVGGDEAWKVTELLKTNNVPVILGRVQSLPYREDDAYDLAYALPGMLEKAGVKIAIGDGLGSWRTRDLPFHVGQAIAFGLSPEDGLRSVTLTPAEIFGVEKEIGSLEVGKKATIVVSKGDIFDELTNQVVYEYVSGRKVDLNNKHKELYQKYQQKGL